MGICDYTKLRCEYWTTGPDGSECTEPQVGLCPANDAEDLDAIRESQRRQTEIKTRMNADGHG